MITVVTPFSRTQNLDLMYNHLKGRCNWVVLIDDPKLKDKFPEWVKVVDYSPHGLTPTGICISNVLFNMFLNDGLDDETQYMILCDDDFCFDLENIPNEDAVVISMDRGVDVLRARPEMMKIGRVGGEQVILKGKILKNYRYGLSNVGDGEMIEQMVKDGIQFTYRPDLHVMFNWLEDGRHRGFRRKPIVLFVGDYFCAANPAMGISEWETNIWKSLESTELADVARFHMDKYYYHTGNRGDEALLERIADIKPDYVVLVIYKPLGSDPTVIDSHTLYLLGISGAKIITIWGDLEAEEQVKLATTVESHLPTGTYRFFGTANKEVVESLGYKYMHVPKDPRVFNNPNDTYTYKAHANDGDIEVIPHIRDIDVVFSGSFGYGREERKEVLQYLIDNGVKLVAGGSEGKDHFTTEEYADRYKRAKIAISFSQARGKNVVNARVFEVMSCGAMLLEQESPELEKLYRRSFDYAEWLNKEDLLMKIKKYLADDEERRFVADNGYQRTMKDYSALTFWKEVLK